MPSKSHIKRNAENDRRSKDKAAPVHGDWRGVDRGWEEAEEHGDGSIDQTENVDNRADDWTHPPRSPMNIVLDGVVAKAFV
jgi:hypothetical protein